jgi:hypothetical protein
MMHVNVALPAYHLLLHILKPMKISMLALIQQRKSNDAGGFILAQVSQGDSTLVAFASE